MDGIQVIRKKKYTYLMLYMYYTKSVKVVKYLNWQKAKIRNSGKNKISETNL